MTTCAKGRIQPEVEGGGGNLESGRQKNMIKIERSEGSRRRSFGLSSRKFSGFSTE